MSAEIEHPLTRLDSAVSDTTYEPGQEKQIKHRRTSSTVSGVFRIEDLGKSKLETHLPALHISDCACRKGEDRPANSTGDAKTWMVSLP
jgi:hypothetical protein